MTTLYRRPTYRVALSVEPQLARPAAGLVRFRALKVQLQEREPVAQRLRRVIVRLHLGEAETPVQRQRLGLPDTGVEIHAGVCLAAGRADQFGIQRPALPRVRGRPG